MISPQRHYIPCDQPGIPLELSPRTSSTPHHQLFPSMESKGEIPVFSLGHSEVSAIHTPHIDDEQEYVFPPKCFPYRGRVSLLSYPETSGPMFLHGYTTLAQLASGTPSASPLYKNPICSYNDMPTVGFFIQNTASRLIVQNAVTSILVQLTIPSQPVSSFQSTVSGQVLVSSSIPPSSRQIVPPPGEQDLNIPLMLGETSVSGLQTHMIGMNQPLYGIIPNPVGPSRSGSISTNSHICLRSHSNRLMSHMVCKPRASPFIYATVRGAQVCASTV